MPLHRLAETSSSNRGFRIQRRRWRRLIGWTLTGLGALVLPLAGGRAAAQEWAATLQVRAGAMDGPGSLGDVFRVAMGPKGEILAAQPAVPTISVFDSIGHFVRDVGRAGEGPGEFGILGALGWTADTLWVMDVGRARLHLFDRELEFVRTITPMISDLPPGAMRVFPGPLLADGSIMAIPMMSGAADSHPLILLNEDGSVRRTLPPLPYAGHEVVVRGSGGPIDEVANPWSEVPLWTPAADGRSILIVHRPIAAREDQGRLRIIRLGLQGDTLVDREFVYRPRPIEKAELDRVYHDLAERLAGNPRVTSTMMQVEDDVRASLPAPPYYPPVTKLIAGDDGTIWLRRQTTVANQQEWQVFSEEGEMLGRVHLPQELEVHGAERGRVWGVSRNELDVSFVEVYGVNRGAMRQTNTQPRLRLGR